MNNKNSVLVNPILPLNEYIPDGEPRVFGDRVYLYGSHDIYDGDYCSYDLHVYSAPINDLSQWIDHGVSFSTNKEVNDVEWSNDKLFAPDVVEKNGIYYLYFCLRDGSEGVATSLSPTGPFANAIRIFYPKGINNGEPLSHIDPACFVDDDGSAYYYWGQFDLQCAKLKDNMYELEDKTYNPSLINESDSFFHEGSSMRKIGDTYYLIYCSIVTGRANNLDYAISKSPLGPFVRCGTIINNSECDPGSWNNHGSIERINGRWYIFYHRSTNNSVYSRRACVEPIFIDDEGKIAQVEMTSIGFGNGLNAYSKIQAAYACSVSGGNYLKEYSGFKHGVTNNKNGCIIAYKYLDFGSNVYETVHFKAMIGNCTSGKIQIRLDNPNGKLLGVLAVENTKEWIIAEITLRTAIGKHAVYFKFIDGSDDTNICDVEWFEFYV